MASLQTEHFDLALTLRSGQFFHFIEEDGWFYVHHKDRIIKIRQDRNKLMYHGATNKTITHFLSLDKDLTNIKRKCKTGIEKKAFERFGKLRLLRQDPWHASITFICSSCANMAKIRKNIFLISEKFGAQTKQHSKSFYLFPEKGDLTCESTLRSCATGYRAPFIAAFNTSSTTSLQNLDYSTAKEQLMQYPGIGSKVADCILLFGYGFGESFPLDIWMRRIMQRKLGNISDKEILNYAAHTYRKDAGYIQQYLYMYAIENHK